jgi:hypothetical protein
MTMHGLGEGEVGHQPTKEKVVATSRTSGCTVAKIKYRHGLIHIDVPSFQEGKENDGHGQRPPTPQRLNQDSCATCTPPIHTQTRK